MTSSYIWTSEYVSAGHPDKVADQISDAVLDFFMMHDPKSRVACETLVKSDLVVVAGEITSRAEWSEDVLENIIRATIRKIGYDNPAHEFNAEGVTIQFKLTAQSSEISGAVDGGEALGAGDQGIMFGYASRETPALMPLPIFLSRMIANEMVDLRKDGIIQPDFKTQVSIEFEETDGVRVPKAVSNILVSACQSPDINLPTLREIVLTRLQSLPHTSKYGGMVNHSRYSYILDLIKGAKSVDINPAGEWHVGGPTSDSGLTGRKIVVDQYGADCEIGGGAFSGKDPSKVDRSGAYMARYIAKNLLVQNEDANTIKVQLAYVIGKPEPASVRAYDPTTRKEYDYRDVVTSEQLTPSGIIETLDLEYPIYLLTAGNGHFGFAPVTIENLGVTFYPWEALQNQVAMM